VREGERGEEEGGVGVSPETDRGNEPGGLEVGVEGPVKELEVFISEMREERGAGGVGDSRGIVCDLGEFSDGVEVVEEAVFGGRVGVGVSGVFRGGVGVRVVVVFGGSVGV